MRNEAPIFHLGLRPNPDGTVLRHVVVGVGRLIHCLQPRVHRQVEDLVNRTGPDMSDQLMLAELAASLSQWTFPLVVVEPILDTTGDGGLLETLVAWLDVPDRVIPGTVSGY